MALPQNIWFWWTEMIIAIIGIPILIILCIVHCYNVLKDLVTFKRKKTLTVAQKSDPKLYKSLITLSMMSIAFLTCSNILDIIWMWNYKLIEQSRWEHIMEWDIKIGSIAWLISKQAMYLLFILRLHATYKSSQYKYNTNHLIIIGIVSGLATSINIINILIFTTVKTFYYDRIHFAVHFNSYYPLWVLLMAGFPDAVMSMIFIYSFTKPLKIVINNIDKNAETIDGILELYNTGIKALILTSMSLLTTLIFLLCILFTDTLLLLPIDSVINALCMMMITPYYPDDKYYQNLCILPIKWSKKWTDSFHIQGVPDESTMNANEMSRNISNKTTTKSLQCQERSVTLPHATRLQTVPSLSQTQKTVSLSPPKAPPLQAVSSISETVLHT